jgi:hypothetical protein
MLSLALGLLLAQSPAVADQATLTPAPLVAGDAPVTPEAVTASSRTTAKPDRGGAIGLFGFGMALSVGVSLSSTLRLLSPVQPGTWGHGYLLAPLAIIGGVAVSAIPLLGPAVGLVIDGWLLKMVGSTDPGLPWRLAGNAVSLGLQVVGTVLFAMPAPKPQGPAITGLSVSGNGLAVSGQF